MALGRVLEGILNDFSDEFQLSDLKDDKKFEYLINYLVVSKYHPDAFSERSDLDGLVVDEKGQFGLDAIAFIVNNNLVVGVEDISTYARSKTLDVEMVFIQSKTADKCDSGDLLKTIQATKAFLNESDEYVEMNQNMLNAKEIYKSLFNYRNFQYCTGNSPRCHIYFVTASKEWEKGLISNICSSNEEEIRKTSNDIKEVNIDVLGSNYILDAYNEIKNRAKVSVNLKNCVILEKIAKVKEAYIGYLTGDDYLKIIEDNNGDLRRRIFYDNVRDYQGIDNNVNRDIRKTLSNSETRDKFVLLNNGVTIITKSLVSQGSNQYELSDFQIVNGCQTSNEIYNCNKNVNQIYVPVKIIYTTDTDLIGSIVKSTNRQSPVPEEAFIALNRFHKNLQMLFSEYSKKMPIEMFYERRSGEESDVKNRHGKYQDVTLHGLIRAFVSVYMQKPYMVYKMNPANILNAEKDKLFKEDHPEDIYYFASYFFAKFVFMQQEGKFNGHDYRYRFYIIMVVRMLIVQDIDVPSFSSKDMKKEVTIIEKVLKNNSDEYFIKAKELVESVISQDAYLDRNERDVMGAAEFNKKVIAKVAESFEKK